MSRKRQRVRFTLDTGDIKKLTEEEIKMILRGADELIAIGGRNMLVKILKGSKDKKVLEHGLDTCPAYGFYHNITMEQISHRVDWMIKRDYLRIEYRDRLPMLVFSEIGWEIERETFTEELYQRFCQDVKAGKPKVIYEMKDVNRQVVLGMLDKIEKDGTHECFEQLDMWQSIEVRKIRERIDSVKKTILQDKNGEDV